MFRPLPVFMLFVTAFTAVLGWGWLGQAPTGGELAGDEARIRYFMELIASEGRIPTWLPGYLTGTSTTTLLSFPLALAVYFPGLLLTPEGLGMKLTALVLLGFGAVAAFALGRRLTGCGWTGFSVGSLYLMAPQTLLRAGWHENMTLLVAIPLVPLLFLALLRVAERGAPFDGMLLGTIFSATLLVGSKIGTTLVIPLALFAVWIFFTRPESRGHLARGAIWSLGTVLLLGVAPLIPLLRERHFLTVFDLHPMAALQTQDSVKTATAWLDRGGTLFATLPPSLRISRGGYYLGLVGLVAMIVVIVRNWRTQTSPGPLRVLRIFLSIAVVMFWFSFGPRSVMTAQFELLGAAMRFPDAAIPLVWLTLAAQGFVILWLLPMVRWRLPLFLAAFAVYLTVPPFRVLQVIPLFHDLPAPATFWIFGGTIAWSVAAGIAVVQCLNLVKARHLRPALAIATVGLAIWDSSANARWFFRDELPTSVRENFERTSEALASSLPPGRIYPISGRHFILNFPIRSGRGLTSDALNSSLATRDTALLQTAARLSPAEMVAYLRVTGVAGIFLEKDDPTVRSETLDWWRALLPVAFENSDFLVLKTAPSLYPAFFATTAVPAPDGLPQYPAALRESSRNVLTLANPVVPSIGESALPEQPAPPFSVLPIASDRSIDSFEITAPGADGWIVLGQSWHPDWKAAVDGVPRPIIRGAGAFPAVRVGPNDQIVRFRFTPPAWISASLTAAGIGWVGVLGLLTLSTLPVLPRKFRKRFVAARRPPVRTIDPLTSRPTIYHPLVLIPTYNERASILEIVGQILAAEPRSSILVIDDASPDGTAAAVRGHESFGERLHLIERAGKLGLGSAYRDGFHWAMERNYDACVEIDADLSHDPADIPRLLAALDEDGGCDAAVGSRYVGGVRVINWPQHRLLLSAAASRYVRLLTGLPLTDATSGFKALRTEALRRIDWSGLRADGYGFQIELHWLIWAAGGRIVEIPIVFTERRSGQTKMSPGIAVEAAVRVLQLAFQHPKRND